MSVAHKIATVCTWGTGTTGTTTTGKILSLDKKTTAKSVEQEDENGELYSLILHDRRVEISLEVLATASSVRPATGTTLTLDAIDYIVTDSSDKWTAGGTKKISISAFRVLAFT